jgi:hypothetical protein
LTLQGTFPAVRPRSVGPGVTVPRCGWRIPAVARTLRRMKKRVFAALLWFYTGWYAGAMIAELVGISPALGPIIGTAAAALIAGDPRGIIWTGRSPQVQARVKAIASSAPVAASSVAQAR